MVHVRLLRLVSHRGGGILAGAAVGLLLSALAITQALAMSALFTGILERSSIPDLVAPFAVLAAVLLLRPLATGARELVAHAVASRMKRDLRARILDHDAARGPLAVDDERLGARHALLVDGVENLEPYVTRYVPQVIVTAVTSIVTVGLLVRIDPVVGIVVGAAALVVPLIPRLWDQVLRGRGDEHWAAYAALHADIVDSMRGMETLKLLGAADRRRSQLATASGALLSATLRQLRISLVESGLTAFLLVAGPALALAIGVARVASGALVPSALFTVTLVGFEVFRPFRDLANHWHAGYLGLTAGSRLLDELEAPVDEPGSAPADHSIAPPAATATAPAFGFAIELEDVRARYPGAEHPALDDLSLRVPCGSFTAIVGPSGAGKSTVANIILGLLAPERGRVAIAAARDTPPVTLISQDPVLFSGTLRDNLSLVAPDSGDPTLRSALAAAQASEFADARDGLDTPVGDGGSLLSGGQKQRVAIARGLLRGSSILLLDEATSALDPHRERALLTGLRTATAGEDHLTVVLIAHRLTAIRDADLIIVIDQGRAVEQGSYDELVAAGGVFAQLHAAQAERVDS